MKKGLIIFIFICLLIIIFIPSSKEEIDFEGEWNIEYVEIDGKQVLVVDKYPFGSDKFRELYIKNDSFKWYNQGRNKQPIEGVLILSDDTLELKSNSKSLVDAKYHLELDTIPDNEVPNEELKINVTLTAEGKMITMSRTENIGARNRMLRRMNNNRGMQRGKP